MKWYKSTQTPMAVFIEPKGPMRLIRYAYFAFVFSIPFDAGTIEITGQLGTLSKLLGFMFVMTTLLQPSLCFRPPPKAFWYFAIYLYIFILMIFWHGFNDQQFAIGRLFTLSQLLILFWLSYNLMLYEHMRTRTLEVLAISCTIVAVLMILNLITISSDDLLMTNPFHARHGRSSAFGANPNSIAAILALGLLTLVGLAFGQERRGIKTRLLAWPCLGIFAIALVRTGTRGAVVAIMVGLLVLLLKSQGISPRLKSWVKKSRLKIGLAAVVVVGFIVIFSYQYEPIRVRWEKTFIEGNTSGRERIVAEALPMFFEQPWLGWGPGTFADELGARLGMPTRDPHNAYLWLILEVGLVGAAPFFAGLWLCWRSAWRAGGGIHSVLPAGLLAVLLTTGLKGTNHKGKLFWIVLAYALASGSVAALPRMRKTASSSREAVAHILRRKGSARLPSPVARLSGRSASS